MSVVVLILQMFNTQMVHDLVLGRVVANEAQVHAAHGAFVDAASDYGEAYLLSGDATMILNQALCWQKAGAYTFAYASAKDYLRHDGMPPEEREQAEKLTVEMRLHIDIDDDTSPSHIRWSHADHDRRYPHGHKH